MEVETTPLTGGNKNIGNMVIVRSMEVAKMTTVRKKGYSKKYGSGDDSDDKRVVRYKSNGKSKQYESDDDLEEERIKRKEKEKKEKER